MKTLRVLSKSEGLFSGLKPASCLAIVRCSEVLMRLYAHPAHPPYKEKKPCLSIRTSKHLFQLGVKRVSSSMMALRLSELLDLSRREVAP